MRHARALSFLTLGYWRRRGGRVAAMLLGVAAGVALLGAVLLANDAVLRTYEGWTRGVLGRAELEVRAVAERGFPEELARRLSDVPGVAASAPAFEERSYLFKGEAQAAVNVRGVDPPADAAVRPLPIVSGRSLEAGDTGVAVLSYAAALALEAAPGSDVELMTAQGVETLRVVGVYHPADGDAGTSERAVLVALPHAQRMFVDGRRTVTRVDVALDGASPAGVEARLASVVGDEGYVRRAHHTLSELAAASADLRAMLLLAGMLAAIAAGLLIVVHARSMLDERTSDLALLAALGVPRRHLRGWLTAEVGAVVAAGAVPGLALAGPVAHLLLRFLPEGLVTPFGASLAAPRLGLSAVLGPTTSWLLVAVAVTLLAALLLAKLFGRLGRALEGAPGRPVWVHLAGALLRQRRTQAATSAAALLLTLSGLVGIHGVAESSRRSLSNWLDSAVTWDLRVAAGPATGGAPLALPGATVARVAAIPGVAAVTTERQLRVASRGHGVTVVALGGSNADLAERLEVVQAADLRGSPAAFLGGAGQVALSVPLAARLSLSVGDQIPLSTHAGEGQYTVVALVDDSVMRGEAVYVGMDEYVVTWGDDGVDSISVRLTPGAEASAVAQAVSESTGLARAKVPLHVTLAANYRSELLSDVVAAFRGAQAVVLLAVVVALLGLLASSVAAAWHAQSQLGLLRALGARRRLLMGVVGSNLAIAAGVGAILGAALGTALSLRLSLTMSGAAAPLAWHWPLDAYATVALLLILTGAGAALLLSPPARLSLPRSARR